MRVPLYCLVLSCATAHAASTDSLIRVLDGLPRDTTRSRVLAKVVRGLMRSDPDSALGYAHEYLALAEELHDPARIARGHSEIGLCLMLTGDHHEALPRFLLALQWYEEARDTSMIATMRNNIAEVYKAEGRHELEVEELRKAHIAFRSVKDTMWTAFTAEALASAFEQLGMRDSAFFYFDRTAGLMEAVGSPQHAAMVRYRQSTMLDEWGNDPLMRSMQEQALAMLGGSHDRLARSIILTGLGRTLARMGQNNEAEARLREALALAVAGGFKQQIAEAHQALAGMFQHLHSPDSALVHFTAFIQWHDSLNNEERSARIAEVQERFDSARKDAELERRNALIAEQRSRMTLYLGTASIMAVVIIALVLGHRRNLRNRRALQERNTAVETALKEKELLLRELNHRVKNNMQTVGSLLRLQARNVNEEGTRRALQEAMMRVKSLALVHQDLYSGTALTSVPMDQYVGKLARGLLRSHGMEERIRLTIDAEPVNLDVDSAVPFGLILNELITNAIKHAFPRDARGSLLVSLKMQGDLLVLEVRDDGVGYDPGRGAGAGPDRLLSGAGIVDTFAESLGAEWSVINEGGTTVRFAARNVRCA